jgi:hypothetical protein
MVYELWDHPEQLFAKNVSHYPGCYTPGWAVSPVPPLSQRWNAQNGDLSVEATGTSLLLYFLPFQTSIMRRASSALRRPNFGRTSAWEFCGKSQDHFTGCGAGTEERYREFWRGRGVRPINEYKDGLGVEIGSKKAAQTEQLECSSGFPLFLAGAWGIIPKVHSDAPTLRRPGSRFLGARSDPDLLCFWK